MVPMEITACVDYNQRANPSHQQAHEHRETIEFQRKSDAEGRKPIHVGRDWLPIVDAWYVLRHKCASRQRPQGQNVARGIFRYLHHERSEERAQKNNQEAKNYQYKAPLSE